MTRASILVLGLTDAGRDSLPAHLYERIAHADLLVGGKRHLAAFPEFTGERLVIESSVEPALVRLQQVWESGATAVVLASGDPLWYGIGVSLRRVFPPDALEILPAPTSAQLAFAALAEPWHDAVLLSAHGRPVAAIIPTVLTATKAAILTDRIQTPAVIARALIEAGLAPNSRCAVCEQLGGPRQRVIAATLADILATEFDPLNVLVVWNEHPLRPVPPGLPDEVFSTEAGQITKREVRLLSLAELALQPGEVLWDIGAGSGSVAIEAARACPTARVYAVERRANFIEHIRVNLSRFPAPNLHLTHGEAPEACSDWPDPAAIFVGGSGGRLREIIALARQRLRPRGRLVLNLVLTGHLTEALALLPTARVMQVQINRAVPIQTDLRLVALNPVFVVTWMKDDAPPNPSG
ncbi:precorrin-6y C5,15-methyltransferase (decarboxylating) subunit CbiE [Chloroflexus sp.]|uniref:precorrin-6y C5,15-methyltransferase (decarboxylating) subunit CbiE n=1 Tax=Chloroflexus sp. TaxID=1904827 RepID=UPI00262FBFF6|nr:precorrin-6y C5,15-methyltransferase (decarboxylating) subunit CbiE [uncultured Chloroflexus sp.]